MIRAIIVSMLIASMAIVAWSASVDDSNMPEMTVNEETGEITVILDESLDGEINVTRVSL